jgi:hypothetical protein
MKAGPLRELYQTNLKSAFLAPDHTNISEFLDAWSKLLRLINLHRLNQTPQIAADDEFRLGLQDTDFVQKHKVTLTGRTQEDVRNVLQDCDARNPAAFPLSRSRIRMCEVGPAAFFCELHFETRSAAEEALLLFQNHAHVNSAPRRVKVSVSVESDTGGLLIRPISVVEALASACKLEIESDVYSSAFARWLQPNLMNPVVAVEDMSRHLRECLSDPHSALSKAMRIVTALSAGVINRVPSLSPSLSNLRAARARGGVRGGLDFAESLSQELFHILQATDDGLRAAAMGTAGAEPAPGGANATAAALDREFVQSILQPVQNIKDLIAYSKHLAALLTRPFYPAAIAFGSVSSLMLPMTLVALLRGPTALDLPYSVALGAAGLAASVTHGIVSGISSKFNASNNAVYFRAARSFAAAASTAAAGFFVGRFLQKVAARLSNHHTSTPPPFSHLPLSTFAFHLHFSCLRLS